MIYLYILCALRLKTLSIDRSLNNFNWNSKKEERKIFRPNIPLQLCFILSFAPSATWLLRPGHVPFVHPITHYSPDSNRRNSGVKWIKYLQKICCSSNWHASYIWFDSHVANGVRTQCRGWRGGNIGRLRTSVRCRCQNLEMLLAAASARTLSLRIPMLQPQTHRHPPVSSTPNPLLLNTSQF